MNSTDFNNTLNGFVDNELFVGTEKLSENKLKQVKEGIGKLEQFIVSNIENFDSAQLGTLISKVNNVESLLKGTSSYPPALIGRLELMLGQLKEVKKQMESTGFVFDQVITRARSSGQPPPSVQPVKKEAIESKDKFSVVLSEAQALLEEVQKKPKMGDYDKRLLSFYQKVKDVRDEFLVGTGEEKKIQELDEAYREYPTAANKEAFDTAIDKHHTMQTNQLEELVKLVKVLNDKMDDLPSSVREDAKTLVRTTEDLTQLLKEEVTFTTLPKELSSITEIDEEEEFFEFRGSFDDLVSEAKKLKEGLGKDKSLLVSFYQKVKEARDEIFTGKRSEESAKIVDKLEEAYKANPSEANKTAFETASEIYEKNQSHQISELVHLAEVLEDHIDELPSDIRKDARLFMRTVEDLKQLL